VTSFLEAQCSRPEVGHRPVERGVNALDGGEYVRLAAPQRRQAPLSQFALELPDVFVSEGQVVDEVDSVLHVVGMNSGDLRTMDTLQVMHEGFEPGQLGTDGSPFGIAR